MKIESCITEEVLRGHGIDPSLLTVSAKNYTVQNRRRLSYAVKVIFIQAHVSGRLTPDATKEDHSSERQPRSSSHVDNRTDPI